MPRKADAAALAILLLAAAGDSPSAQETARPVAPSVTGVVPGLVRAIPLRNQSRRELRFFVHDAGGWQAYTLAPGNEAELLANFTSDVSSVCTPGAVEAYEDALYAGVYQLFEGCEGTAASTAIIVASPVGGDYTIFVNIQIANDADFEALDKIIASFRVIE